MQRNINLRIMGNPNSQGGFTPLIIRGVIDQKIIEEDRVLPISDTPAICLCHKEDQILYMLHDYKLVPNDSQRDARLSILLSIPKNHKIKGNVSPYDVLMEVYQFFVSNCMHPEDASGIKRFKDISTIQECSDQCKSILDKYPLEEAITAYVTMNPNASGAILHVAPEDLATFFKDTQYPDFYNYKEIYVSTINKTSDGLANAQIDIPRKKEYEIWQNDKRISFKRTLSPADEIKSSLCDTADIKYEHIRTTFQDLLLAPNNTVTLGQSSAYLDNANGRIILTVKGTYQYMDLVFRFSGDEKAKELFEKAIKYGKPAIILGGTDITSKYNDAAPKVLNSESQKSISISPNLIEGYFVKATTNRDINSKTLEITITVTKKQSTPVHGGGMNSGILTGTPTTTPQGQQGTQGQQGSQKPQGPQKPAPKPHYTLVFIIALLLGIAIGAGATWGYNSQNTCSKQYNDSLLNSYKDLENNLREKNWEIADLNKRISQLEGEITSLKTEPTKPSASSQQTQSSDSQKPTAIEKIENRPDFKKFMELVNNLEYTNGCDKHPIMTELKNNRKLQQYAWAIDYVCNPKTFFGTDKNGNPINNLNAKMNKKQDSLIRSLPTEYKFSTLKDVKQEADSILIKLKKLK